MSARTAVLAAANPKGGHYNRGKSVGENIKTNAALLSRFDLVFILVDKPDEQHDRMISGHILAAHRGAADAGVGVGVGVSVGHKRTREGHGAKEIASTADMRADGITLTQRLRKQCAQHVGRELSLEALKSYIDYARRYCMPAMTPAAAKVLQRLYLNLRSRVLLGESLPITTRHLESLIRLAQARARMDMRSHVTEEDALEVVDLLHESLLEAFTSETGRVDLGAKLTSKTKQIKAIVAQLHREAAARGGRADALFSRDDIRQVMVGLHIDTSAVDDIITTMHEGLCYLLKKGARMYALA
jgi:DNA helicase MCM8